MSFVGPTTMAGWGNVPLRRAHWPNATGLPAFLAADMAGRRPG